jgi:hypothetical protein
MTKRGYQWFSCMYFSPPNITRPIYSQKLIGVFPPPIQNFVAVCKQITYLLLHQVKSALVTLLKFIYFPTRICNFLVITVSCNVINFLLQVFLVFIPELPKTKRKSKLNSMASVRERTIPTERPPLVVENSANFW